MKAGLTMISLHVKVLVIFFVLVLCQATAIAGQNYFIEEGCSGGFTGGGGGTRIYRDGRVFSLIKKRFNVPAKEAYIGKDANSAARLFKIAESNGFLDIKLRKYGNMTCHITYHSPEYEHSVYCGGSCLYAPMPVVELSDEINKLRNSLSEQNKK